MNNYITLAGASNGLPYCYVKLFQNANFNHCTEHLTTLHQTEEHPKSFLHRIKGYETIRNWFCNVLYGFVLGTIAYLKVRDISLNKVCAAKLLMAGSRHILSLSTMVQPLGSHVFRYLSRSLYWNLCGFHLSFPLLFGLRRQRLSEISTLDYLKA